MEEKTITKEQILKEMEKVLDLYEDDILSCGFELQLNFKNRGFMNIKKNLYAIPYRNCCEIIR